MVNWPIHWVPRGVSLMDVNEESRLHKHRIMPNKGLQLTRRVSKFPPRELCPLEFKS